MDNHRRRNRPTQPPDEDVLQAAAKAQLRDALPSDTESSNEEDGDDEEDGDNEDNEDEDEDGPRPRAARNSKYNGIAKPTILRYYKGTWKAAIHTAKISFHKFVLFQNAFPTMEEHLVEAHDALLEVISDFKNKGRVFSQGKHLTYCTAAATDLFHSIDVIHSRNMDVVVRALFSSNSTLLILFKVFKEAATFRGRMKTYCRSLVPRHYKDAIFPDGEWENQQGYFEKIQTNIQELLDNSTFHLAGKDEQVAFHERR